MSIASITITRNDWHVLEQWRRFYLQYADAVDYHIIVDNSSTVEYKTKLRELFPEAILLERTVNGGTTGGYNTGIKWALNKDDVEAIMLIANDIDFDSRGVTFLHQKLSEDTSLGAVAPILLQNNHKIIIAYGETLDSYFTLQRLYHGHNITQTALPDKQEATCLPGGMCMVKSEVYRKIGLQAESLFMYMDENEFFLRASQAGYRMAAFRDAVAAHCHIAVDKGRHNDSSLAFFYIYRNRLLVCRQYGSWWRMFLLFNRIFWLSAPKYVFVFVKERSLKKLLFLYLGLLAGVCGFRKNLIHN